MDIYTVIGDNLISQLVLYRNFEYSYANENCTIVREILITFIPANLTTRH